MSISTIIVDDEKQAREGLVTLLKNDQDIQVVAICKNGMEAITQIQRLKPQLLFLDIQMPEINGFDVLNSIPKEIMPLVIFTTAYDQYALKAFEVHAMDYLLKPFSDDRFYEALDRVKSHLRIDISGNLSRLINLVKQYESSDAAKSNHMVLGAHPDLIANRLIVKSGGKIHFLELDHIIFAEAQDYYIRIVLEKQSFLIRESLKTVLQRLSPEQFIRIHRSAFVNLHKVRELSANGNGDYTVKLSQQYELRGSRNYRQIFELI